MAVLPAIKDVQVFRQYGIETDHYLLEKNWTKNQMV
jgi:hypothetical protein